MYKFRIIIIAGLVMSLTGCVSMLSDSRGEPANQHTFKSLHEALPKVPVDFSLSKGDFINININIKKSVSPRVNNGENTDFFEIVEIEGVANQEFSLTVHALCDCLGFRKWAILPESSLFDPEGKEVNLQETGSAQTRTLTGKFGGDGKYKLVVVANSKFTGVRMSSITTQLKYGTNLSLPLVVHPTGMVQVAWAE